MKSGMEVSGLEETHAAPLAEVAKQVEFLVCEETAIVIVEDFQIFDELTFAFVKRHRADFNDLLSM